jgi:hypothetical protein
MATKRLAQACIAYPINDRGHMNFRIQALLAFKNNYLWLIIHPDHPEAADELFLFTYLRERRNQW